MGPLFGPMHWRSSQRVKFDRQGRIQLSWNSREQRVIYTAPLRMEVSSLKTTRPPTSETSTLNMNRETRRILMIERALIAGFNSAQNLVIEERTAEPSTGVGIGKTSRLLRSTTRPLRPNYVQFLGLALASWGQNSSGSATRHGEVC